MKKTRKFIPLLFCCLFMCLLLFPQTSKADSLTPTAQDNLSVRLRRSSDLIPVSDGYMRVFKKSNSIGIEYYDNRFQITGKKEITKVKIDEEVVDPDDIEMLEDLIVAATNEALRKVEDENAAMMQQLTGGLGGLF